MTQERQQTLSEINHTLEQLFIGFKFIPYLNEHSMYVGGLQARGDYARVTIGEDHKWNEGALTHLIYAKGSICQMNPDSDTNELRWAASQIQRAAGLVDAINALGLQFTEYPEMHSNQGTQKP